MVYIKRVELTHFKSFGGTADIPLLPGFTVVSGPNGSGKSNILDGLLFALGLSTSKGMRADRLPDLVNQNVARSRSTVEASVTATFDLEGWSPTSLAPPPQPTVPDLEGEKPGEADSPPVDGNPSETKTTDEPPTDGNLSDGQGEVQAGAVDAGTVDAGTVDTLGTTGATGAANPQRPGVGEQALVDLDDEADAESPIAIGTHLKEWSVTRRLRVTPQGTYTSTYAINGEVCTLTQLHEQLNRLRIYPEGYNIVLQGDVTGIISMNGRERREIIDELAGVAQFDRKINQAKGKLDEVKEREERCHIIERELQEQLERLSKDRQKAEKYQRLRRELEEKQQWEKVLVWQQRQKEEQKLVQTIAKGEQEQVQIQEQLAGVQETIAITEKVLEALNQQVRALGEEELLQLQSQLATQEAELRQILRQQQELEAAGQKTLEQLQENQAQVLEHQKNLQRIQAERSHLEGQELVCLTGLRDQAQAALAASREAANAIATRSQAWVTQQTQLRQRVDSLVAQLEPLRREQAQLQERSQQYQQQQQGQSSAIAQIRQDLAEAEDQLLESTPLQKQLEQEVANLAQTVAQTEQELQVQQDTQSRLLKEQREKQRQLDKLESMAQAMQETQGTQATRLLEQLGLAGVHGAVAQLGDVEARYRTALEIAAGGRLTYLVVEDDRVAAEGIRLLKQHKGGRATFLPLNKIRGSRLADIPKWQTPEGFVDHAVNLVQCDDRYRDIFSYVFGGTVVFESLDAARRQLGQYRMVTLEGDLLESSGAMTGGSLRRQRGAIGFGRSGSDESSDIRELQERLEQIEVILGRCDSKIASLSQKLRQTSQDLTEKRQSHREVQLEVNQLRQTVQRLQQQQQQLLDREQSQGTALTEATARLQVLETLIPTQDAELAILRQELAELEQSPIHGEWQERQHQVQEQEQNLQTHALALRSAEQQLQGLIREQDRSQEQVTQRQGQIQRLRQLQGEQINEHSALGVQRQGLETQLGQLRQQMAQLEERLGSQKQERDRVEREQRQQRQQAQDLEWQGQKLQETQQQRREQLAQLRESLVQQQQELPDPPPDIPEETQTAGLAALQHELRNLAKRIQAMEPVNMLALEEYDRTQARLDDLTDKLQTLESERTEILLRIETFTTLRTRAFMESFEAVNQNFREIFAQLSDGDGYLQLDSPEDPLSGGLNLVAHPKGKPVRRLASMSGGEKSLTALSFIFALQRYRPSPFYAFDEVDSFLDGANVERLAQVIRQQCHQAQFIVVSHRRPMIEAAQRTIGVTQARGAHTQVVGIALDDPDPQAALG
ncbi:MAG: chromosome segregation protein SMC [Prochlorothrix sp.]